MLYPRHNRQRVLDALADTRVVLVVGARQVGKSTLLENIADTDHPASKIDLDDQAARQAALVDPEGFIAELPTPALIDEVQRGGSDLLLAIKGAVDEDRRPGRYMLTGSANVLASRHAQDALTGRIETVHLWPLAQSEIHGSTVNVVDALFAGSPPQITGAPKGRSAFAHAIAAGGFPEPLGRPARRRSRWFADYVRSTLERDLRDISDAQKLEQMPRLLRALAARAGNIVDHKKVAVRVDLDEKTVKAYTHLLELVFLVRLLPAWRPGITSREGKKPKVHVVDTGLLLFLLGADEARLRSDDQITGKAAENFAAMEIVKHLEWAETDADIYHYRGPNQDEIDLILEDRSGNLVAIEVKAAASVAPRDLRELEKLRDRRPGAFRVGVLFYAGERTLPIGDRLWAVPFSGLWTA